MKTSNKVQLALFIAFLLFCFALNFHLLPKSVYSLIPISVKEVHDMCHYRYQQGSCAVFKCKKDFIKVQFSHLKYAPIKDQKYVLHGDVIFRNQKEICAGLNNQDDTYFKLYKMSELKAKNHE